MSPWGGVGPQPGGGAAPAFPPDLLFGRNTELLSPLRRRRPVAPSFPRLQQGAWGASRGSGVGAGGTRSPPGGERIRRRRRPAALGRDLAWALALGSSGEEPGGCSWRRPAPGGRRSCVQRPGRRAALDSARARSQSCRSRLAAPEPSGLRLSGLSVFFRQPKEEGALSLAGPELQRQRGARPREEKGEGAESARAWR